MSAVERPTDGPDSGASVHPRSFLATATRDGLVERIQEDAARVRAAEGMVRDARREREQALAREEAALELAAQYARKAGVDVSREAALQYVSDYWERRGRQERDWQLLEAQRWEVLRLALELGDRVEAQRTELGILGKPRDRGAPPGFTCTANELALRVASILGRLCSAQGMTKRKAGDLDFERPPAPVESTPSALFEIERTPS